MCLLCVNKDVAKKIKKLKTENGFFLIYSQDFGAVNVHQERKSFDLVTYFVVLVVYQRTVTSESQNLVLFLSFLDSFNFLSIQLITESWQENWGGSSERHETKPKPEMKPNPTESLGWRDTAQF